MSQDQPTRTDQGGQGQGQDTPIRYGDVFLVAGDLAGQAVAPRDAAMMQSAETRAYGQVPKGGPASVMESAASYNEQRGLVAHDQFSEVPANRGVSVTQTNIPGRPDQRLVTEFVAGQAVGQYMVSGGGGHEDPNQGGVGDDQDGGGAAMWTDKITIGEALEATGRTVGDKPVEPSDAAAIQAAEAAATGIDAVLPGGLAAAAQVAVVANTWAARDEDKAKLGDVLTDATARIIADKEATREDAKRVVGAEVRTNPNATRHPAGVGAAVAAAARLNEDR